VLTGDPTCDQEARDFRLAHIDRCLAARDEMPSGTIVLDSGLLGPAALADEVLSRLRVTSDVTAANEVTATEVTAKREVTAASEPADKDAATARITPGPGKYH
jgi:hypothetical protein